MTEHFDTASPLSATPKRPLKVFLCHAHADRDAVKALYARLTADGVDIMPEGYAWLDKEKPLPGQGLDRLDLPDWELEIHKAVREVLASFGCIMAV
jgi:CelD/BcsL family acetyltransferase involved in cellulose biosynthesis